MTTESATSGEAAVTLPYVRVYADDTGDTKFADEEFALAVNRMWAGRVDAAAESLYPTEVSLRRVLEDKSAGHTHPAPARQIIIPLQGEVELEVSDGTRRRLGAGSIILMDDAGGNGHISRWVGSEEPLFIVLKLS